MKKLLVILILLFPDHGAWANNDSINFETCKNYGFKEGTEQFGMCMLKLKELSIQQGEADASEYQGQLALQNQRAINEMQRQQMLKQQQKERDQRTYDMLKEVHKFFCIRDTGRDCP